MVLVHTRRRGRDDLPGDLHCACSGASQWRRWKAYHHAFDRFFFFFSPCWAMAMAHIILCKVNEHTRCCAPFFEEGGGGCIWVCIVCVGGCVANVRLTRRRGPTKLFRRLFSPSGHLPRPSGFRLLISFEPCFNRALHYYVDKTAASARSEQNAMMNWARLCDGPLTIV